MDNSDAFPEIDTSMPHTARIYDYFLGGKDNFAADREVAKQALKVAPAMLTAVRENRAFLGRAVRYLAEEARIAQFLDLGSGLPSVGNVHEVAQDVNPAARVVYVDNDVIVLAHGRALLTSKPEGKCAYLHADIKDPRYILRHPITRATLDFGEPIALILNAVLHFVADEEEPGNIVQTVVDALPSGSYVVASHGTAEYSPPLKVDGGVCAYQQGGMPVRLRDRDDFADLAFTGLTLVPPGVVVVSEWHPEPGAIPLPAGEVGINGAVARKPLYATGGRACPEVSPLGGIVTVWHCYLIAFVLDMVSGGTGVERMLNCGDGPPGCHSPGVRRRRPGRRVRQRHRRRGRLVTFPALHAGKRRG